MHIVVKLPPHDRVLLLACPLRYFCRYISEDFLCCYDAVAVSVGSPLIRYWVKNPLSAHLFSCEVSPVRELRNSIIPCVSDKGGRAVVAGLAVFFPSLSPPE